MNRNEVGAVLTTIKSFHEWQELGPDAEDAWFDALDGDIDALWAVKSVAAYYGNPETKNRQMLPSELNREWRLMRKQQREEDMWERTRHDEPGQEMQVRMPYWFQNAMNESFGSVSLGDMEQRQGTQEIFDRHAAEAGIDLTVTQLDYRDSHCGKAGCNCTHTGGCYKGWVDTAYETRPCKNCRDSLADILALVPGPGWRSTADFARIRERFNKTDDH